MMASNNFPYHHTKKRCSNFTSEEKELLVMLVDKYKDIIGSKKSCQSTWAEKEKAWKQLETEFNIKNSRNIIREVSTLREKLGNMKKELRKRLRTEQVLREDELTPAEKIIESIINEKNNHATNGFYDSDNTGDFEASRLENHFSESETNENYLIMDMEEEDFRNETINEKKCDILQINLEKDNTNYSLNNPGEQEKIPNQFIEQSAGDEVETEEAITDKNEGISSTYNPQKEPRYLHTDAIKRLVEERLINEKRSFLRFQKNCFIKEHKMKMDILTKKMAITNKKLNITNKNCDLLCSNTQKGTPEEEIKQEDSNDKDLHDLRSRKQISDLEDQPEQEFISCTSMKEISNSNTNSANTKSTAVSEDRQKIVKNVETLDGLGYWILYLETELRKIKEPKKLKAIKRKIMDLLEDDN